MAAPSALKEIGFNQCNKDIEVSLQFVRMSLVKKEEQESAA